MEVRIRKGNDDRFRWGLYNSVGAFVDASNPLSFGTEGEAFDHAKDTAESFLEAYPELTKELRDEIETLRRSVRTVTKQRDAATTNNRDLADANSRANARVRSAEQAQAAAENRAARNQTDAERLRGLVAEAREQISSLGKKCDGLAMQNERVIRERNEAQTDRDENLQNLKAARDRLHDVEADRDQAVERVHTERGLARVARNDLAACQKRRRRDAWIFLGTLLAIAAIYVWAAASLIGAP